MFTGVNRTKPNIEIKTSSNYEFYWKANENCMTIIFAAGQSYNKFCMKDSMTCSYQNNHLPE